MQTAAEKLSPVEPMPMKNRVITLFGEIDKDSARRTNERLLAMSFESEDPITLIISSPGGHVESGDSIFDMIQFLSAPVRMVGTGWVGSAGALICLARRVFGIEITACPHCGGRLRMIGDVTDPHVIDGILEHVRREGLPRAPPARSPAA